MSGFSELELIKLSAKALAAGVKDADPNTQWYESVNANAFVLAANKVWVQSATIKANPAANVAAAQALATGTLAGLLDDRSVAADAVQLTAVPGVNNTYVALNIPGDFTSGVVDNWILPQFVPQPNGLPSFGYAARVYDGDPNSGGTEVLTTDGTTGTGINKTVAWIWDYATGILLVSDTSNLFSGDPYLNGFIYTGKTVADLPTVSGEIEFLADCPPSTLLDDLVYVTGPSVLGVVQVATADVTVVAKMPAIGIVTEKISSTRVKVLTVGEHTPGFALTPGRRYFVGPTGQLALTMPTPAVGGIAFSQPVGHAIDTNRLIFNPELIPIIRKG